MGVWHIQEYVVYARTTHIGFRSAAQLNMLDLLGKQYTGESLPGD